LLVLELDVYGRPFSSRPALRAIGSNWFRELIGFLSELEATRFAVVGEAVFEVWSTPYLLKAGEG
jgi:hypothetical protein